MESLLTKNFRAELKVYGKRMDKTCCEFASPETLPDAISGTQGDEMTGTVVDPRRAVCGSGQFIANIRSLRLSSVPQRNDGLACKNKLWRSTGSRKFEMADKKRIFK